jgi:hypothetical protein
LAPSRRVEHLVRVSRKVPASLRHRGNVQRLRRFGDLTAALPVEEELRLILLDRSGDARAEQVIAQRGYGRGKERARVERIVAEVLVG